MKNLICLFSLAIALSSAPAFAADSNFVAQHNPHVNHHNKDKFRHIKDNGKKHGNRHHSGSSIPINPDNTHRKPGHSGHHHYDGYYNHHHHYNHHDRYNHPRGHKHNHGRYDYPAHHDYNKHHNHHHHNGNPRYDKRGYYGSYNGGYNDNGYGYGNAGSNPMKVYNGQGNVNGFEIGN